MNRADRKEFDVSIPLKSVQGKWRESLPGEPDEVNRVFEDLRRSGLGARGAAGKPGTTP